MRILATLTVRNEAPYIHPCLAWHIAQGLEIILIDNDSTDETLNLCEPFLGKGLLSIAHLPYPGYFDLTAILEKEAEIQQNSGADWLLHLDADEILQSYMPGESLAETIRRIDGKGYQALAFDEFVFLPENESIDYSGRDYLQEMQYYYYFRPHRTRLVRAFKNGLKASNLQSGGHILEGARVKIYREKCHLRHYIGLSAEHLRKKYVNRNFAAADLAKGWSKNRVGLTPRDLALPPINKLAKYDASSPKPFCTRKIYKKHYWEW